MLPGISFGCRATLSLGIALKRLLVETELNSTLLYSKRVGYGSNLLPIQCAEYSSRCQICSKQRCAPFSSTSNIFLSLSSNRVLGDFSSISLEADDADLSADRILEGLPEEYVMEFSGHGRVQVDHLDHYHLDSALDLIRSAVERGDNVGFGELPSNRNDLQRFLGYSSAFTLTTFDGRIQALLIIEACFDGYFRSVRPHIATLHIIRSAELSSDLSTLRDLSRLAVQLTGRFKRGYCACAIGVFYVCVAWYQALQLEGWAVTACIQQAGVLEGCAGYTPSHIMIKNLLAGGNDDSLNKVSMKSICAYSEKLVDYSCYPKSTKNRLVHSLPMNFYLNDGKCVMLRNARSEESEEFFKIFNRGGYGIDEFPTQTFFNEFIYRQSYNIVVEEQTTNDANDTQKDRWISVIMISDSSYSRYRFYPEGGTSPVCDIYYAAVGKSSKGRGYGSQLVDVSTRISKDLGYVGYIGDASMENIASARLMIGLGFVLCGVVRKSVRYAEKGWTDSVIVYKDLAQIKSFLPKENSTKDNES